MNRLRLLITGANGTIGRIIMSKLRESYDVYGLDVTGPYTDGVMRADISEINEIVSCFERIGGIQFVLHMAGQSHISAAWDAVLHANIIGTRNIYEAARLFKVQRVIFASSNHVTGAYEGFEPHLHLEYEPELITVQHPVRPDSDYGVSKAFGEAVARYYCARWGVESICLRIGTVLSDDDPRENPRFAKTWLSHRDLIQLIERSITAHVTFGIYYGVSNNLGSYWDISNARYELGYNPVDDASNRVTLGKWEGNEDA